MYIAFISVWVVTLLQRKKNWVFVIIENSELLVAAVAGEEMPDPPKEIHPFRKETRPCSIVDSESKSKGIGKAGWSKKAIEEICRTVD